jgi:Cu+-exporting ATPase
MHPEVRQIGPGTCPICGMALEPLELTAAQEPNPELRDMTRRFWFGVALAIPIVILAMGAHLPALDLHHLIAPAASNWLQLVLATPVVLWAGAPFFQRAAASLITRNLNMFTLIALGTGASWLYSVIATLAPASFPAGFRDPDGTVATYFEPAAVITVLVLLGQLLELRAREQTGSAIRALLNLAPKTAHRLTPTGEDEQIPLDQVIPGDRLRIRPGEAVPTDGTVLEGQSAIDEAMLTGEAMPVTRHPGDRLIGGTLNTTGSLIMRADQVGSATVLAQIVAMVAEAQRSRAPIQRLADAVAGWFVPAVIAIAIIAFIAWALWGPPPALAYAMIAAVSVLIIACPCALGLATPMSIMVGVGKGATIGVLIRSADALERLEKIDTLVVDKTGTLTEGKPRLVAITPIAQPPTTPAASRVMPAQPALAEAGGTASTTSLADDLLTLAAGLERASEHPLAAAIVAAARDRALPIPEPEHFRSITGKGVTGTVNAHAVALGNLALMRELGIPCSDLESQADALRQDGATALHIAIDHQSAGLIAIADPIKPTTPQALRALRAQGIRIVMLTGDNRATAAAIAHRLDITDIAAELLPEQKIAAVRRLKAEGHVVAMAGDGVNDAPALAEADIGIAMGTGTEVAMAAAGVTLVKGDLAGIARAITLSRATMRNIRQNLFFAFVYNAVGVPLAAGVLYPEFGILLSPVVAALAMSLSSVSVIGNALRLRHTTAG